ncbi:hypothetical protein Cob_v001079 [Colletotrichum orbiculare MAFF 240422]|uniref:Uncharacterized protein n=1 Tax=Colletotrichum orbiculare (strain 104-T / ATCC 96160 / CBS 514.97 / LARS 414 / MAFF 240422) TaxID=1213857 RepID=A0A484G6W8_COLOR|nr:hypothetical protein Cob_v001079 [Colletotrichum orbiculare MAFF 240422]
MATGSSYLPLGSSSRGTAANLRVLVNQIKPCWAFQQGIPPSPFTENASPIPNMINTNLKIVPEMKGCVIHVFAVVVSKSWG